MGIAIREVHYTANTEDQRANSIVCKWWGFGSLEAAGVALWPLRTTAPSEWKQDNLGMNKVQYCYWTHYWYWESLQRIGLLEVSSPLGKRNRKNFSSTINLFRHSKTWGRHLTRGFNSVFILLSWKYSSSGKPQNAYYRQLVGNLLGWIESP